MKNIVLITTLTFIFITFNSYADEMIRPIEEFYKENARIIAPHDINADEETRSTIPGIFNDITKGGENSDEYEVVPKDHRTFSYGFHRTLQSLTDIGNGDKNVDHLDKMLESEQVTAFINAAQTQPAAAAGLHYGLMNSQLTLVNQQLSHSGFFMQMNQMPDGAKLIQSMYTNCIYPAMTKGKSFAVAQMECIGDTEEASSGSGEAEVANAEHIPDSEGGDKADLKEKDTDKILCTDLIFNQQKSDKVEDFRNDFVKWVGDEETIINSVEDNSGAAFGRKRLPPETPVYEKYMELVWWRFEEFTKLMENYCKEEYQNNNAQDKLQNLLEDTENNIWTGDTLKESVGMLSIEGFDFNTLIAEAMLKGFYKKVQKRGDEQIDCSIWKHCTEKVYTNQDGYLKYDTKQAAQSPVAKKCKFMHDYVEGVALGHTIEALARARNIVLSFTASSGISDARECGMRIIHDQIKTNDLESVQYHAIAHLIKVGSTVMRDMAKESGANASAASSTLAGQKESNRSSSGGG